MTTGMRRRSHPRTGPDRSARTPSLNAPTVRSGLVVHMVVSNRGQPDISVRLREDTSVRLHNRTICPLAQPDRLSGCRDSNGNRRIGRVARGPGIHRPPATGQFVRLPGFQRSPDPRTNVQPIPVGLPTMTRRPPLHGQKSHPLQLDQHPTHVPVRLPGTPRQRSLRRPRHTGVIGLIRQSQQHQHLRRPQILELPHPIRRPRTHDSFPIDAATTSPLTTTTPPDPEAPPPTHHHPTDPQQAPPRASAEPQCPPAGNALGPMGTSLPGSDPHAPSATTGSASNLHPAISRQLDVQSATFPYP